MAGTDKKKKTFQVSDETINSYKIRILNAGLKTEAFLANPVMLFMHRRGEVIGAWANLRQEDGKWLADADFDVEDDLGKVIGGKVERGFIRAASIGVCLNLDRVEWNEALTCYDCHEATLIEISVVDIPSNQNAICLYDQSTGEPMSELTLASKLQTLTTLPNQPMQMESKAVALALGLPETATAEQLAAKALEFKTNADNYTALKAQTEQQEVQRATKLVDAAVADGRIKADQKDSYLKLFKADFALTEGVLAGIAKPANLVEFAQSGKVAAEVSSAAPQETTAQLAARWDEMQKASGSPLLALMKGTAEQKAEYKKLYKAKFGTEPTLA